jgi:hypothetical protein
MIKKERIRKKYRRLPPKIEEFETVSLGHGLYKKIDAVNISRKIEHLKS